MELIERARLRTSYFMNIYLNFIVKRLLDVLVSSILLLTLSPLLLIIAYRLFKHEGRPIIFKEPRIGKDKRLFIMYTFRIKTPPRQLIQALPPYPAPDNWRYGVPDSFKFLRDESFYTEIGLTLKKYKLHRLPRLFNVLKGDMSLVGPKPEHPEIAECFNRHQANRLKVRPGLTGYAQLNLPNTAGYDDFIKADLHYISQQSLFFDLKILYQRLLQK